MTDPLCPFCSRALEGHPPSLCLDAWVAKDIFGKQVADKIFNVEPGVERFTAHPADIGAALIADSPHTILRYSDDMEAAQGIVTHLLGTVAHRVDRVASLSGYAPERFHEGKSGYIWRAFWRVRIRENVNEKSTRWYSADGQSQAHATCLAALRLIHEIAEEFPA
jgi:hypothetical protein